MALPTTFGTLTSTSGSLALLDGNFNALGALVTVIGTVTGTNAIAFTQATNNPAIASYANYMRFGFVAANTSTGTVTFKVNSLAALNLYGPDGVTQIGSGGIVTTVYYEVVYNSALNSGAGGFQLVSAATSNVTVPVPVSQGGTGDTSLTAYALLAGGTGTTAPVQSIASVGTSGQVLTSNGASALPTFQTFTVPSAGQPIPTTSSFAVGTLLLMYYSNLGIANGSTLAGSSLTSLVLQAAGCAALGPSLGASQAGTWKNISGVTLGTYNTVGYWVRTA